MQDSITILKMGEVEVEWREDGQVFGYVSQIMDLNEPVDNAFLFSTAQYSTAQHSTVQHSTVQHSTVQYSLTAYSSRD